MSTLHQNWITEKLIDFEYKKYVLLAYLKEVSGNFNENKLYPYLAELVEHYKQVKSIKENKENLASTFPHRMNGIDMERLKINYEKIMEDDSLMNEIISIIDYSIPKFEHYLSEGKKIYDFIEEQIHIHPVGIIPLYPDHGYLMLKDGNTSATNVYEYQVTIFEQPDVKYRGIHTTFIKTFSRSISNTFENIKSSLVREHAGIPNPATYVIETELQIPLVQTFLPIAKRALVKYLAAA